MTDFLSSQHPRSLALDAGPGFAPTALYLGEGSLALEVCVLSKTGTPPTDAQLRSAWGKRNAGRASPLLIVALYGNRVALCGPAGEDPPAYLDLDPGQAERVCAEALSLPDRNVALRFLGKTLETLSSDLPGLRNSGFLATYELTHRVRQSRDWRKLSAAAKGTLGKAGHDLLDALGFRITRCDNQTCFLESAEKKLALGVLLQPAETPDAAGLRFNGLSPISYALSVADRENLPYVVTVQANTIRLYPTKLGTGVGRRGRTETYIEAHTSLIRDQDAAFLKLLFSADALSPNGSLETLVNESVRFAGTLAENLRERIYGEVMPALAQAIATARNLRKPSPALLAETYEMAMAVLFRLLFVAYAEDKDLLPYKYNGLYRRRSLKTKAQEILQLVQAKTPFTDGASLWEEVSRLFRAVDEGNREWGVPHYNGGLFAEEADVSKVGSELKKIALPNAVFGPILRDLLLIKSDGDEFGPVDFGSLGVREFGTIYEGLLESELSVAETDLALDKGGNYIPTSERASALVKSGKVYLHNRSGARKSTGSYFTKPFAVDHLLDFSLEPALGEHIARLNALDDVEAGEAFFDFRVADIAMGSGHFLVAAIDRIEKALSAYLAKRKLPLVSKELLSLREAARSALGTLAEQIEIEDNQILRRLIAKRCIYGVDLNPVGVQLARLAIWIHTFVPGLPLSLLDRNLVSGNSLIGVGTVEELKERFQRAETLNDLLVFSGLVVDANSLLKDATEPLARLARISDCTYDDIKRGHLAIREAEKATAPARALCDIITALPLLNEAPDGEAEDRWLRDNRALQDFQFEDWDSLKKTIHDSAAHRRARKLLAATPPFHFPIAFPEVFLRSRSGFDVMLGNPPWDKIRFEDQQFWVCRWPGYKVLAPGKEREKKAAALLGSDSYLRESYAAAQARACTEQAIFGGKSSPYSLRGNIGHLDYAKLFCERALRVTHASGHLGIVLPRQFLVLGGWGALRTAYFNQHHAKIWELVNNGKWVFEDVHASYRVVLLSLSRSETDSTVELVSEVFAASEIAAREPLVLTQAARAELSENDQIPSVSAAGAELFAKLCALPRLGDVDATHLHGYAVSYVDWTQGEAKEHITEKQTSYPIVQTRHVVAHGLNTHEPFKKWAKPLRADDLVRSLGLRSEAAPYVKKEMWADGKAMHSLRLAFRYPSRADDTRTIIAGILPLGVLPAKGYAHWILFGHTRWEERLLATALLNSAVLDWFARRLVDRHVTDRLARVLPVPRFSQSGDIERFMSMRAAALARSTLHADELPWKLDISLPSEPAELRASIDAAAFVYYGLSEKDAATVFDDFSEEAFRQDYRSLVLKEYAKLRRSFIR